MVGYNCFIIFQYYYLNIKILKFYENFEIYENFMQYTNLFLETSVLCTIYQCIFRNIRAMHDLSMYFPKFQQIKKIS
jgi:hypothetical protein